MSNPDDRRQRAAEAVAELLEADPNADLNPAALADAAINAYEKGGAMKAIDIDHPAVKAGAEALFGHHPERGGAEREQAVFAVLSEVINSGFLIPYESEGEKYARGRKAGWATAMQHVRDEATRVMYSPPWTSPEE